VTLESSSTIYFGKSGEKVLIAYNSSYPNYGIHYFDDSVDKFAFSASGNANSISGADLCINGNGDGTVTIRGNSIIHAGNYTSYCATSGHNHDGRYIRWSNATADTGAMGWGTLTSANGYNILAHCSSSDGGDMGWCYKGGQISYQVDGFFYQNEGRYKCIDEGNISSQSVNYATSAGSATSSKTLLTNNTSQKPDACYDANPGLHFYRYSGGGVGDTDGFILQWSWNQGSVGGQLYLDDNPNNYIAIRGCTGSSGTSPTGFTSWYRIYGDNYHPSADYANSAGSVSWSNVTSKPFDSNGNLHISHGTSNNMSYNTTNPMVKFSESGSQAMGLVYTDYDSYRASKGIKCMDVDNSDTANCWFEVQGNLYIGSQAYANSDRRLKKDISSISSSSLDALFNISDKLFKQFTWKQSGKASYGLIAQELEKWIPEAVEYVSKDTKTVNYQAAFSKIIAALVHKVKEQANIIEEIRTMLSAIS